MVSRLNLECIKATLRKFLVALHDCDSSKECLNSSGELAPQYVVEVCTTRDSISPIKDDPHFWNTVQNELLAAIENIQDADFNIDKDDDICNYDLAVLEASATATIHLGLAMALVLCPPLVDPLTMSAMEYHFLNAIVSTNINVVREMKVNHYTIKSLGPRLFVAYTCVE